MIPLMTRLMTRARPGPGSAEPRVGRASLLACLATSGLLGGGALAEDFASIDRDVQALKQEVLALDRDLFMLEEELLFPANTQVAVFVSMDVGEFFQLDAVSLQVNGREVANYLYTDREVEALLRGGVHRLFMGNLRAGEHELVAVFTGIGPHAREYRRGAEVRVEKGIGAKFVELRISDVERRMQPEFVIREWD
jgi:hypothetical protein